TPPERMRVDIRVKSHSCQSFNKSKAVLPSLVVAVLSAPFINSHKTHSALPPSFTPRCKGENPNRSCALRNGVTWRFFLLANKPNKHKHSSLPMHDAKCQRVRLEKSSLQRTL